MDIMLGGDAGPVSEFNTNLFLPRRDIGIGRDVWGEGFDGGFELSLTESRWKSTATGRFQNRWFQDDNNLDFFNQFFSMKSFYLADERSRLGLEGLYNMDNTLTTEDGGDLGLVFRRIPRTTRSLSPSWAYTWDEKTSSILVYSYQDTTYDNEKNLGNVVDSVAHTGSFNLTHQWDEKLQLLGSLGYTSYDLIGSDRTIEAFPFTTHIPGVTSTIRTASFMGGFNYTPTETVTLAFSGGGQHNDTSSPSFTQTTLLGSTLLASATAPAVESTSFSEILSAKASKRFERGDIGFDFLRSISPNLQGNLITYDRYAFTGNYKFSAFLTGNVNITLSDQALEEGSGRSGRTGFADRSILTARTGLSWRWDENWAMDARYTYTRADYASDPGANNAAIVDSHALYFNIRYLFDKHQF